MLFIRSLMFIGCATCAFAQTRPVAFTGARIIPVSGPEIADGVLVVQNGKIVSVGPTSQVQVPAGAERRDVKGKVVMPGLIDSHSHIGSAEGADASSPIQPDVRVIDAIDVRDSRIQKAQAGGITTVNIMPGSGHLLSGQTVYLKLRDGRVLDDLLIKLPDGGIAGGIKMANGTNSRKATASFPGTRAKSASLVREQYVKAQEYRAKVKQSEQDPTKAPGRDLRMEALVEALDRRRTVHHHTHAQADIMTVRRLAKEFNLKVVLQHGTDSWKVADQIAAAKLPVSLTFIDSPGGKIEARDVRFETAGLLEKAGVLVGFNTDDGVTDSRFFIRAAALSVRAGMSREKALYGLTKANAIMLDMQQRVGSLEPGKDADLIVLSGDPLSVYTHVLETWVEGTKVFDRSNPKDKLYAVGGYGASHDSVSYMEELEEY
jgi:imidazolonepropionase-like amidohydrolase